MSAAAGRAPTIHDLPDACLAQCLALLPQAEVRRHPADALRGSSAAVVHPSVAF